VTLKQFHIQIVRLLAEDLVQQGFKYVSVLPSGYAECHDLALANNLELIGHESRKQGAKNCYFCSNNRKKNQQVTERM
jgi:hypothetical protein